MTDLAHTFLHAVKIRGAFLSVVSQTQDIAKYFPKGRVNFDLLAQDFLIMGDLECHLCNVKYIPVNSSIAQESSTVIKP